MTHLGASGTSTCGSRKARALCAGDRRSAPCLSPALSGRPRAKTAAPPLLQAIRDTRKGQAELSEVLGEAGARSGRDSSSAVTAKRLSVLAEGPDEAGHYRSTRAYQEGLRESLVVPEAPFGDDETDEAPLVR